MPLVSLTALGSGSDKEMESDGLCVVGAINECIEWCRGGLYRTKILADWQMFKYVFAEKEPIKKHTMGFLDCF